MTHVATSGTGSCATISISRFKGDNYTNNIAYMNGKPLEELSFSEKSDSNLTPSQFYNEILYPTSQPLGKSKEVPFEALMEGIENCGLRRKMIFVALNEQQSLANDGYWVEQLKRWEFVEVDRVNNDIGMMNRIFIRNVNRPSGYVPTPIGGE